MDSMKLLEEFADFLEQEKRSSKNTVESYMRDIKQYISSCDKRFEDVNKTDIISYIMEIEGEGKSKSTVSRKIASIRCFYQFLINTGRVQKDPTLSIKSPKQERKMPETLSQEEVKRLLSSPDTNTVKGLRDKAILELMYGSGLKVGEVVELKLEDVNLNMEYIRCGDELHGARYIPLGKRSKMDTEEYLKYGRHVLEKWDRETLFLNLRGEKLTRQGLWKLIKQYAAIAKIEKNINPLTLRHSFAIHMMENGADIKSIQELLGHMDLSTTQIYQSKTDEKLKDVYRKTHPRAE